jgi:[acyl-carrier-protein] S-malonyltransferase
MLTMIFRSIFGTKHERDAKRMRPAVEVINALEPAMQALSDVELRGKTDELRKRLADSGDLEALLPEAFAACREAAQGDVVEPANYNSPGQVVIAGAAAAVQRAIEAAKARGAKRAVLLPVSVPSHSSLMQAAAVRLQERLAALEVRAPKIRYVSAVDARAHEDPQDIRALLVRQLSSPVRWSQTLSAVSAGVALVIECGPGKVLTGLNRRIEKRADLTFLALEDPASLDAALAATNGAAHA